jgi:hypothetical protein
LVTATMVSILIPRRSRSLRNRGPKVSLSDMTYQTPTANFTPIGFCRIAEVLA